MSRDAHSRYITHHNVAEGYRWPREMVRRRACSLFPVEPQASLRGTSIRIRNKTGNTSRVSRRIQHV